MKKTTIAALTLGVGLTAYSFLSSSKDIELRHDAIFDTYAVTKEQKQLHFNKELYLTNAHQVLDNVSYQLEKNNQAFQDSLVQLIYPLIYEQIQDDCCKSKLKDFIEDATTRLQNGVNMIW